MDPEQHTQRSELSRAEFDQMLYDRQPQIKKKPKDNFDQCISIRTIIVLVIVLILFMLAFFQAKNQFSIDSTSLDFESSNIPNSQKISLQYLKNKLFYSNKQQQANYQFSKILWVQTQHPLGESGMIQEIVSNNLIHFGMESGYEVRIVDNFNAYDWLSSDMIQFVRQTKHKSLFSIDISHILRLALLFEHGGVSIKHKCFLNEKLDWIANIFENGTNLPNGVQYFKQSQVGLPEILLFFKDNGEYRLYEDHVIVARKGSKLLKESLIEMSDYLVEGEMQDFSLGYFQRQSMAQNNEELDNLFINLVNAKYIYWYTDQFCTLYNLMTIDKNAENFIISLNSKNKIKYQLMDDIQDFQRRNGRRYIIQTDLKQLSDSFYTILKVSSNAFISKDSIFRSKITDIKNNSWMVEAIPQKREVHYCIISLKILPKSYHIQLNKSIETLQQQTYKNWKAVYFVQEQLSNDNNIQNVKIIKTAQSQGLNLQQAAAKQCDPNDIGILLNYNEKFEMNSDLFTLTKTMSLRKYFGAFLSVKKDSIKFKPVFGSTKFARQLGNANYQLIKQIFEHFRVFSISSYRFLPHMALHDNDWNYYDRETVFLSLLQMGQGYEACEQKDEIVYHLKKIQKQIDIPKYRADLPQISIIMVENKLLNMTRPQYYRRQRTEETCKSIKEFKFKTHRNMRQYFNFNDGKLFKNDSKELSPLTIPKKVHTIIIGQQLSKLASAILFESKHVQPKYQHFTWNEENLTRTNFPYTYDIIQALMKSSKLIKGSNGHQQVIINLMKLQILYWHGGMYLYPQYFVINMSQLERLFEFQAILPSIPFPGKHQVESKSIIATAKHYEPLRGFLSHQFLSSINFYSNSAKQLTGSVLLSRIIKNNGNNYRVFQSSVQYFQPQYFNINDNAQDKCKNRSKRENLQENTVFLGVKYNGNCEDKYYWALGIHL